MNRQQRRAYQKRIKNDISASICPICKQRTRFFTTHFTTGVGPEQVVLKCEINDDIVYDEHKLQNQIPAGIFVPLKVVDLTLEEYEHTKNVEAEGTVE